MKFLVTAGNTQTPIDAVRCITNIFTGRTGTRIALEALQRGHEVTLLTSHPEVVEKEATVSHPQNIQILKYQTFDDLQQRMQSLIPEGGYEVIIHSAAVSDYQLVGIFAPDSGTDSTTWKEVSAGKVKSSYPELWFRLVPTPKLVDSIRSPWGFRGILVKFKLEVGITDEELIAIAHRSRAQSDADLLVANTLEGRYEVAFFVDRSGSVERIERAKLAESLLDWIER